jgi:hypothetical protein
MVVPLPFSNTKRAALLGNERMAQAECLMLSTKEVAKLSPAHPFRGLSLQPPQVLVHKVSHIYRVYFILFTKPYFDYLFSCRRMATVSSPSGSVV